VVLQPWFQARFMESMPARQNHTAFPRTIRSHPVGRFGPASAGFAAFAGIDEPAFQTLGQDLTLYVFIERSPHGTIDGAVRRMNSDPTDADGSTGRAKIKVQNIVATCNVGSALFLPRLARLPSAEFNVKRFAAVTVRLMYPRTTALFFGSGKVVCTGARTRNAARLALLKYVRMVRTLHPTVGVYGFKIQNVVASANLPFRLALDTLRERLGTLASYEPELFPGLVYRPSTSTAVFLLFKSGRIVITGCKSETLISEIFRTVEAHLTEMRPDIEPIAVEDPPESPELVDSLVERLTTDDAAVSQPTTLISANLDE